VARTTVRRVLCLADVDVVAREDDHARVVLRCVVTVVMRARSLKCAQASRSVVSLRLARVG
jgi:hypothetical protein